MKSEPSFPVPKGGFDCHEDEARWLEQTILLRTTEGLASIGVPIKPAPKGLYEVILSCLKSAGKREAAELQAIFNLRWDADMRAIKQWQAATGRTLTLPDHADLCVWLLEQLEMGGR